jgi:glycosyltransferase involved in cell wall biosynthesis
VSNAVRARNYPDRYAARRRLDVPAEALVVLCLARLVAQKRHDLLLKAWQEVAVDAVLLIAGDGPLQDDLQRQAEKLDIAPSVRFLGARSDVDSLLSAADITVLTSDWEGLPLAVLESMAAGRPVVATDVGGIRDVLAGGGGVVVPPREPATTARVLTELLSDSAARERAAELGRSTIENYYHPATMVSRYDGLFRGLISAGQPVRAGSVPRSP